MTTSLLDQLTTLLAYLNVPAKLDKILANQEKIMTAMTDLQASVAAEDTAIASAITLLQGLSAALAAAGTDPAAAPRSRQTSTSRHPLSRLLSSPTRQPNDKGATP